ncbi:uncharacterized protein LOC144709911 isoform X2 [Wolffia australiana]
MDSVRLIYSTVAVDPGGGGGWSGDLPGDQNPVILALAIRGSSPRVVRRPNQEIIDDSGKISGHCGTSLQCAIRPAERWRHHTGGGRGSP